MSDFCERELYDNQERFEEYMKSILERDKVAKPLISYGTFSKYICFVCGDDVYEKDNFCRNCGQRVKGRKNEF